ncbi:hypothetical protein [Rheinheimera sp. SA_1]|uniref:hypothetical protein n=1 Tax=Rheinheimera sp. SA_1 TaxID=1827365 RepID=UPI000A6ADE44|nr:hypothetical protein [Rheinheimera sp. SA_1]
MKWIFMGLLLPVVVLTGCSVRPVTLQQDYQSVRVTMSGTPQDTYALVDQMDQLVSQATVSGEQLIFQLPPNLVVDQCFSLQSLQHRQSLAEPPYFMLSLVAQYRDLSVRKMRVEQELQAAIDAEVNSRQFHTNTMLALEQHPAFAENSCLVPPQQVLPAEPFTKCQSEQECRSEGGAICFSLLLGNEGCGIAAQQLQIPGLLSNPGCSAIAAELAGEKYQLDQAVVDALAGYADDIANQMIQSESGFDQFFGILLKGVGYAVKLENALQCTNDFVQRHFGPKLAWQAEVQQIIAAPQRLYSQCQQFVQHTHQSVAAIHAAIAQQQQLQPQLAAISEQLTVLQQLQLPLDACPGS